MNKLAKELQEINEYTDDELLEQLDVSDEASERALNKQFIAMKIALVSYLLALLLLVMNAIFWSNLILSLITMLYILAVAIVVEVLDRKSSAEMRKYTNLINEAKLRTEYLRGLRDGRKESEGLDDGRKK